MLLLAAYNTQKEKYEVITVPFCKQNPEEIKKKKKSQDLAGLENICFTFPVSPAIKIFSRWEKNGPKVEIKL